jgi:hypothetical protein
MTAPLSLSENRRLFLPKGYHKRAANQAARPSSSSAIWHEKWQFNGSFVAVLWHFLAKKWQFRISASGSGIAALRTLEVYHKTSYLSIEKFQLFYGALLDGRLSSILDKDL